MSRLIVWIIWCLLGFCLALCGCRAAITAEKLEASVTIDRDLPPAPPKVEVHIDQDSDGSGRNPPDGTVVHSGANLVE